MGIKGGRKEWKKEWEDGKGNGWKNGWEDGKGNRWKNGWEDEWIYTGFMSKSLPDYNYVPAKLLGTNSVNVLINRNFIVLFILLLFNNYLGQLLPVSLAKP